MHITNFKHFLDENGNIVQIIEESNNNTWDIEYDSNPSFITFNSLNNGLHDAPLPGLSSYLIGHIKNIYDFIYYTNQKLLKKLLPHIWVIKN